MTDYLKSKRKSTIECFNISELSRRKYEKYEHTNYSMITLKKQLQWESNY